VWHLVDTLPNGPEKTAAQTALAGDDAAVATFLHTRNYPGKTTDDRRKIFTILNSGPGPNLKAAAERALAGPAADAHQFLRSGRHTARTADERIEVYRVMETGGPQVKAAAQVALAGPASYVSYFLTASRYQAAQRDLEQATHVESVNALIRQAQQYAETARADAAEANRVAAVARNAAAEAQQYANQAADAANRAAQHAADAQASAAAARASADQAAQSATTARNAANSAQASADAAAQSAASASAAARRASADARAAQEAKRDAREAANAAGRDAVAANLAAQEAADIYATKLDHWETQQRNAGNNEAHRTWSCLVEEPTAMSTECLKVYVDFAGALVNPVKCNSPANNGSPGCQMLDDIVSFVEDNPDLVLDMLQLVLMTCGLIPGAGEVCDGIDAAISFGRGDVVGGLLSLGAMVPVLGWLAAAAKSGKAADKLRNVLNIADVLARGCRRGSSFVPGTRVLLADGRTEEIEDLAVGDSVVATQPVVGLTEAKVITATIESVGAKQIVDVTVDVDGNIGPKTATISASENHPFWIPQLQSWVPAAALVAGLGLGGVGDTLVPVVAVSKHTETTRVHNLTVAGFHTYYVLTGYRPILVHNEEPCVPIPNATRLSDVEQATAGRLLKDRSFTGRNLRESPDLDYDYIDDYNRLYDAFGAPGAYQHWDPPVYFDQFRRHINKQGLDFVVVDVTGASSSQLDEIFSFYDLLSRAEQSKIKLVGD
jgi:hypothetical protein